MVDDGEEVDSQYTGIFSKNGFQIIEASDGMKGLEKALENKPDIIFTGIIMLKMDGFQLIESLEECINCEYSNYDIFSSQQAGR